MKAGEFDRRFDHGEDVTPYLDLSSARRGDVPPKRVNVDFPEWMVAGLDKQAAKMGVTRQSVIKVWIGERLQQESTRP
jgi:hypothetical protein